MSRQNFAEVYMPVMVADQTAVPGTTEAILWDAPTYSAIPAGVIDAPGKKFRVRAGGVMTTAASPGTLVLTPRWGTTTAGTTLGASVTSATLVASQTNVPWFLDMTITVRTIGTAGSLVLIGCFESTALSGNLLVGGAVSTVNTFAATGIVVGATHSVAGSSSTTRMLTFESLN